MTEQKDVNRKSFKVRITFMITAILLIIVVLGFTGGLNIASFQQNYTESVVSSSAVSGGETLRKIEYAVKYGKPLDNFYGIEALLQERVHETPDIEEARIILSDGQVIYNQEGSVENEILPEEVRSETDFSSINEPYTYVQYDGQYHVFLPIHDSTDNWVGSLVLIFDESVVQQLTQEYMSKLLIYLLIMALIAAAALIIFILKFSIFTPEGHLRKKRALIGILVIFSVIQLSYGLINYMVFKDAYIEVAEQNTVETVRVVQKDIEFVVNNGVPYSKLYELESYLENILEWVPEIASISIKDASAEAMLYSTLSDDGTLRNIEERWLYESPLMTDSDGVQPVIQVQLSDEYVSSHLNRIILDTITVLVTSFLFMVEITLLVLIFMRRQGKTENKSAQTSASTPLEDEEEGSKIRPLVFILSMAVFMSSAFIPIVMKNLYERAGGLFGLSQNVAVALPMSVEMFFAGLATLAAGYFVDRRGWKPVFFLGLIFLGSGMLLSGLAWTASVYVIARGTAGIGYGLSFMAMRGYVNSASSEKARTDGVASFLAGLYAGINCGVIVGAMLADRVGFAQVFFIAFSIAVIACLFAVFFIENRKPDVLKQGEAASAGESISVIQFLSNPKIIGFFVLIVIPIAICSMFLDYYFPVYAESIGVSTSDVGRAFLINGLFIVYLGPFLSRYITKYISMEKSILFSGLIVVAAMITFAVNGTLWAAFVAVILLGISDSFGLVAQNNYYVKLKASNQMGIGKALGYYDNVRKIGQMLGPMVISLLLFAGILGIGILGITFLLMLVIFWLASRRKDSSSVRYDKGVGV